jgi:hypothetical protein
MVKVSAVEAQRVVPITGIMLRNEGDYTIVEAEIGASWIEVIRERSDGPFSHIVEPTGMLAAFYANAKLRGRK